ncbi:MAG: hypothetical protein K0R80_1992 [Clostridia bacterium]|nr:hypothetical protein [Clostridia bacterium]
MHSIIGKEEKAYLGCMKRYKDQGVHAHKVTSRGI